jgi:hypothetical protein
MVIEALRNHPGLGQATKVANMKAGCKSDFSVIPTAQDTPNPDKVIEDGPATVAYPDALPCANVIPRGKSRSQW